MYKYIKKNEYKFTCLFGNNKTHHAGGNVYFPSTI